MRRVTPDCDRNLAAVGFFAFSSGIQDGSFRSQLGPECEPKPVRFFEREEVLTAIGTLLLLASTHSAAEFRMEVSGPSSGPECEPKPVRFLSISGSGMMASGAPTTRRTSVVSSSAKRHGLCQ